MGLRDLIVDGVAQARGAAAAVLEWSGLMASAPASANGADTPAPSVQGQLETEEERKARELAAAKQALREKRQTIEAEFKKLLENEEELDEGDSRKQAIALLNLASYLQDIINSGIAEDDEVRKAQSALQRIRKNIQVRDAINDGSENDAKIYGILTAIAMLGFFFMLMGMHNIDWSSTSSILQGFMELSAQEGVMIAAAFILAPIILMSSALLNFRLMRICMAKQNQRVLDREHKDLDHAWKLKLARAAAFSGAALMTFFVGLGIFEVFEAFANTSNVWVLAPAAAFAFLVSAAFIGRQEYNLNLDANINLLKQFSANRKDGKGFFASLMLPNSFWLKMAEKFGIRDLDVWKQNENYNKLWWTFFAYFGIAVAGTMGLAYVGLPALSGYIGDALGSSEFGWFASIILLSIGFVCGIAFYRDKAQSMVEAKADELAPPPAVAAAAQLANDQDFEDKHFNKARGVNAAVNGIPTVLTVFGLSNIAVMDFIREDFWTGDMGGNDFYAEFSLVMVAAFLLTAAAIITSWTAGADKNPEALSTSGAAEKMDSNFVSSKGTSQPLYNYRPGYSNEVREVSGLGGGLGLGKEFACNYRLPKEYKADLDAVTPMALKAS